MAAALRVVRRPKGSARRALTAASQIVEDPTKAFKSSFGANTASSRDAWQEAAWDMLDLVGELRYYVGWRSSSCSKVRLIASDVDEETGMPTGGVADDGAEGMRVRELVKTIAGGPLGQSQLIKRATECLTVPGELWIAVLMIGTDADGNAVEQWFALTRDEIHSSAQATVLDLPDGTKHTFLPGQDGMFRIWNPRPRKASHADSPVRAVLDSLREIVRTTKTISNASKSRLIGNGVVFVPHEMSLPGAVNAPVSAGKPGDPAAPVPATSGVQALQDLLHQVAQVAYDDEDSMAALVPIFAGAPGDQVKNVSHLKFDNSVTDIAIKTRNDAIARVAMGLDVSPERLLGLGSNSNHWSAWQIGDEDVRLHIAPVMETIVQAIHESVFSIVLESEGIDSSKYMLWYDASELTADPDNSDKATLAFDRGTITAEAYRDFLGLGDSGYDFTTLEGWQAWATDRVSQNPELLQSLLPLLSTVQGLDFPAPPPALPPGQESEPIPEDDNTTEQEPQTEGDDENSGGQGNDNRTGTSVAITRVFVARALELAGKRRRTRADYDRLRAVPMHDTHRILGPVKDPAAIPDLIKGWDDTLTADICEMLGMSGSELRNEVRRQVRAELTRTVITVDA